MKLCSLLLLFSLSASAMEFTLISQKSIQAPESMGQVDILHSHAGYYVVRDGTLDLVQSHNVDPLLRTMDMVKIRQFVQMGKIKVSTNDAQEYIFRAHGQLNGGGWLTGVIAGAVVRAVGYGVYGYSVVQTGGETVLHAPEVVEAVEATATGAQVLGTAIIWLP